MEKGIQASAEGHILYNPVKLSNHLRRDSNGVVYVDKVSAIGSSETGTEEMGYFWHILHIDYGWGFDNWKNATMYFEVDGNRILGGVYYIDTKVKESRRVIAERVDEFKFAPSIRCIRYKDKTYNEICEKINNCT